MNKTMITKYAMLALLSISFIALNNCGSRPDSAKSEPAFDPEENGSAADLAILGQPPFGYRVAPGIAGPIFNIETACDDGYDNEGDGLVDCQDNDCHIYPVCSQWGPPLPDIYNDNSLVINPNGLLTIDDVAFQKTRSARWDNWEGLSPFFPFGGRDCWISPFEQDPYYNIPLGEPLIAGPDGPIGPQLAPGVPPVVFGPRAGLINECGWGDDLFFRGRGFGGGGGHGHGHHKGKHDGKGGHKGGHRGGR